MNEGNKPKRRQIRVYLGEEAIHKATVESEIRKQSLSDVVEDAVLQIGSNTAKQEAKDNDINNR